MTPRKSPNRSRSVAVRKCRLLGHNVNGDLKFVESCDTYAIAVRVGQQRLGHGHFMVDTGNRTPSRQEQLLQTTKKSKTQSVLDTI